MPDNATDFFFGACVCTTSCVSLIPVSPWQTADLVFVHRRDSPTPGRDPHASASEVKHSLVSPPRGAFHTHAAQPRSLREKLIVDKGSYLRQACPILLQSAAVFYQTRSYSPELV